jgi:hypothetical protein
MTPPALPSVIRSIKRLVAVAAVALPLLAPPLAPGDRAADAAGRGWCRVDPVFLIDGQVAHVRVAAEVRNLREARALSAGPISIVLTVPPGVPTRFLADDSGFGDDYDVRIERSGDPAATAGSVPVRIEAYVPLDDPSVRILVDFAPAGSVRLRSSQAGETGIKRGNAGAEPGARAREPQHRRSLSPGSALGSANEWISLATGP